MTTIRFDRTANVILISAEIIGRVDAKPKILARMVLDTGSSHTIVPWSFVLSIGLDPTASRERVRIITGSGVEYAPRVVVHKLTTLGESLENVDVLCHDLPQESRVDGILGLNFLSKFDLLVNYSEGNLTLTPIKKS